MFTGLCRQISLDGNQAVNRKAACDWLHLCSQLDAEKTTEMCDAVSGRLLSD